LVWADCLPYLKACSRICHEDQAVVRLDRDGGNPAGLARNGPSPGGIDLVAVISDGPYAVRSHNKGAVSWRTMIVGGTPRSDTAIARMTVTGGVTKGAAKASVAKAAAGLGVPARAAVMALSQLRKETEKQPVHGAALMRRAGETARRATAADCRHISPAVCASYGSTRCHLRLRGHYQRT
jgi:hypothetical protein